MCFQTVFSAALLALRTAEVQDEETSPRTPTRSICNGPDGSHWWQRGSVFTQRSATLASGSNNLTDTLLLLLLLLYLRLVRSCYTL